MDADQRFLQNEDSTTERPVKPRSSSLIAVFWPRLLTGLVVFLALAGNAHAAGGGQSPTKLINVADTRGMKPGVNRWIADIYNSNLWLYSLLVVVVMAGQGALLGIIFDRLIGRLGVRLGKLDHRE